MELHRRAHRGAASAAEDDFVAAVLAAPDDDAPRLVYADWLQERGDPRGQFILLQCSMARLPDGDPERLRLANAAWALQEAHGAAWCAPLPPAWVTWERGFVEELRVPGDRIGALGAEAARCWPLRRVTAAVDDPAHDEALARSPLCPRVTELWLRTPQRDLRWLDEAPLDRLAALGINGSGSCGPETTAALCATRRVRALRAIDCSRHVLRPGALEVLGAADCLGALERLQVSSNAIGDEGALALAGARSLGGLRVLLCAHNRVHGSGALALATTDALPSLVELDLSYNRVFDDAATQFVRSRRWRRLDLTHTVGHPSDAIFMAAGSDRLPDFVPRVTALDLRPGTTCDDALALLPRAAPALSAVEDIDLTGADLSHPERYAAVIGALPCFGALKRLALRRVRLREVELAALVDALAPDARLEHLDVRDNPRVTRAAVARILARAHLPPPQP